MHRTVVLARLDQQAVVRRALPEPGIAGVLSEQPELAGQKAFAPVRPRLCVDRPPPFLGVDREAVGVTLDETAHLSRRCSPGAFGKWPQGVGLLQASGREERQWFGQHLVTHRALAACSAGLGQGARQPAWSWIVLVSVKVAIACRPSSRPSPLAPKPPKGSSG